MTDQNNMTNVFISYAEADSEWVNDRLIPKLISAGLSVITEEDFKVGVPRIVEINRAISDSKYSIMVFSPAYLDGNWENFQNILVTSEVAESGTWRGLPIIISECELPKYVKGLVTVDLSKNNEREWGKLLATFHNDETRNNLRNRATDNQHFENCSTLLNNGKTYFEDLVIKREIDLISFGTWEVCFIIDGNINDYRTNYSFLDLINKNNPRFTGWPLWTDGRGMNRIKGSRPHINNKAWETFIYQVGSEITNHVDFWWIDPKGKFYLLKAIEDDMQPDRLKKYGPLKSLDFVYPIRQVTDAIATGITFAKAMGADDNSFLYFTFRWSKLEGRNLVSWLIPGRRLSANRYAYQDDVISKVKVPLDIEYKSIYLHTIEATVDLFEIFEGFEFNVDVYEDIVNKFLNRS